jgi:tRNA threonylcarbamoyl adenosine modification protein (Sua5/YciO/YrdC/YwlC family)
VSVSESDLDLAADAIRRGELVVLPTDTVYGVGADAFSPTAVATLLAAKRRGRNMPPPVLVGSWQTVDGLAAEVSALTRALTQAFWPGALTLVVRQAPTLAWDLGDAAGTVALRMPLHPVALDLLARTGPLAVSSANRSGSPAALTAQQARDQLGETVSVYLDAGPCVAGQASTIVDLTLSPPRLLRAGPVTVEQLREIVPDLAD